MGSASREVRDEAVLTITSDVDVAQLPTPGPSAFDFDWFQIFVWVSSKPLDVVNDVEPVDG
jgi:hypothetical protein